VGLVSALYLANPKNEASASLFQQPDKDFVAAVGMSKLPHILLEGSQDKDFFTRMCETIWKVPKRHVNIATAEQLNSDGSILGNRDKVEIVCDLVLQHSFQSRFIGFVDREFRGFALHESVGDDLRTHWCCGRLVWSRGHSIENYLFEFDVVRRALLDCSTNGEVAGIALEVLEEQFPQVIRIACALGLTGKEYNELGVVRRTVHWSTMRLIDGKFSWDIDVWDKALNDHANLPDKTRASLVNGFRRWFDIAEVSPLDDVRWGCDGHIGLNLIWAAYTTAIYDTAASMEAVKPNAANQRDAILKVDDKIKFNQMASNWTLLRSWEADDSPFFCLSMIGISSRQT
ncbi:MAG: DUF4435 domain-containing protein, partial [Dehalococcoidia bacterium]|nr:DUF4435 domain-containing protein [Dehalococcoidia bacterium]